MFIDLRSRVRLLILELAIAACLLVLAVLVRVEPAVPATTGSLNQQDELLRTPAVFDFVLVRQGAARRVFEFGFPMVRYAQEARRDLQEYRGPLTGVLSWLLGFSPESAPDLVFGYLPGWTALTAAARDSYEIPGSTLERDWNTVVWLLPPGEAVRPVMVGPTGSPVVAIYHTHATESYLPEIGKTQPEQAFSNDPEKTVVKLGEWLASELEQRYRIPSLHTRTMHDSDGRVGAYYRSEATVKAILQKYPDCKVLIDLHRDSQPKALTTATVRNKSYARMMIVIGTNNPNWTSNYTFARKIASKLDEAYPGVSRGIFYASAVYNQRYSPMAILVEVGGVENTLTECKNSIEALAWAIAASILPAAPPKP